MRRCAVALCAAAVFGVAAPAHAQDEEPPPEDDGGIYGDDGEAGGPDDPGDTTPGFEAGTLWIEASTPESIEIVFAPGSTTIGRVIRCGWYELGFVSENPVVILVPVRPTEPGMYVLHCWYPIPERHWDTSDAVPADPPFPRPEPWSVIIPDEIVASYEVAQYAYNSIDIEEPEPQLSPATDSVVGVETWLALGSELEYPEVSAQAGNVWATVQPVFSHVVWEMGNGDTVTCDNATTFWDPEGGDAQSSECTYLFESDNDGEPFEGTVTAYWAVLQSTNDPLDPPVWGVVSRSAGVSFNVRELQAVINE